MGIEQTNSPLAWRSLSYRDPLSSRKWMWEKWNEHFGANRTLVQWAFIRIAQLDLSQRDLWKEVMKKSSLVILR